MAKKTTVLGKVLHRLRRYIPAVVVALVLATAYVAVSLYIPILVGDAIDQIVDLVSNGVDGIHLYTMNNPYVARKITESIGSLIRMD